MKGSFAMKRRMTSKHWIAVCGARLLTLAVLITLDGTIADRVTGAQERPSDGTVISGVVVSGVVVDAGGDPIADAEVRLTEAPSPERDADYLWLQVRDAAPLARTDGRGQFELSDLPAGTFTLWVTARGHAPRELPGIEISASAEPLDLGTVVLGPVVTIRGRVLDSAGEGLPGAWVSAQPVRY